MGEAEWARAPVGRFDWEQIFRGTDVGRAAKAVGLLMATYADKDGGRIFPGVVTLAEQAGVTKVTVIRAHKQLIVAGWIERISKGHSGGRNGGTGQANTYRLTLPLPVDPSLIRVTSELGQLGPETSTTDPNDVTPAIDHLAPGEVPMVLNDVTSAADKPLIGVTSGINEVTFGPNWGDTSDTPPVQDQYSKTPIQGGFHNCAPDHENQRHVRIVTLSDKLENQTDTPKNKTAHSIMTN